MPTNTRSHRQKSRQFGGQATRPVALCIICGFRLLGQQNPTSLLLILRAHPCVTSTAEPSSASLAIGPTQDPTTNASPGVGNLAFTLKESNTIITFLSILRGFRRSFTAIVICHRTKSRVSTRCCHSVRNPTMATTLIW